MATERTEDRGVWARDGISPMVQEMLAARAADAQGRQPVDRRTIRADVAIEALRAQFRAMHPEPEPLYSVPLRDRFFGPETWWGKGFGEALRRKPNEPQETSDRLLWLRTVGDIARTAGRDIRRMVTPGRRR